MEIQKLTEEKRGIHIAQLKTGKIWTNWVWYNTKDGKKTKRPLSKVNDPTTWLTYAEAYSNTEWNGNFEKGIGIMFAKNRSGLAICGIDIDAHRVDENPMAKEILDMFSDTYIERSPSGKGYHILFFAELDKLPTEQEYKELYKQKNSELDVECYISGLTNRYFTFTGNRTSKDDCLINKTNTLLEFLEKYMKKINTTGEQIKLTEKRERNSLIDIDVNGRLNIAMNASNGSLFTNLYHGNIDGYNSTSEAVQAFVDMLVFYFGDGGESLVKDVYMRSGFANGKWGERDTIIDTTIANAFKRVTQRYNPPYFRQQQQKKKKLTEKEESSTLDQKKKQMINYEIFAEFIEKQGYSIKYNQITHNFEFFGFDKNESTEHLTENVPIILQDQLKELYTHVSKQTVIDYITRYATRHKYNPILNAIQSVKWDGVDRINQIYDIFKIPVDTEEGMYSRIFIQKWLMQCVCGLFNNYENPFSLDIILVFQGKQGIGKTRFFEMLALNTKYFGEGICLDPRDKDSIIQATSKWISELGELGSTMKKDMDSVKAFLTKSTDEYRTPYGKASLHYPRITSFVGTVNDMEFLIDQTGNRRFVTIPLSLDLVIDYETQIKPFNALQLWSQVYEIVKNKDKSSCFRLTENEKRHLEKRNSSFMKPMKSECEVLDILEEQQTQEQGYTCTFKEMTVLQFIQLHNLKYDANIVGKVLKKYGYEAKRKKINGETVRVIRLPYKKYNSPNYK
ncbi:MAG: VapE domain-containing protein [Bacillus sp. (in: firmicutes)]